MKNNIKKSIVVFGKIICLLLASLFVVMLILFSGNFFIFLGIIFVIISLILFFITFSKKFKPTSVRIIPIVFIILGLSLILFNWGNRSAIIRSVTLSKQNDSYSGVINITKQDLKNDLFFMVDLSGKRVRQVGVIHGQIEISDGSKTLAVEPIDQLNNIGIFEQQGIGEIGLRTYTQKFKFNALTEGNYILTVKLILSNDTEVFFVNVDLCKNLKIYDFFKELYTESLLTH